MNPFVCLKITIINFDENTVGIRQVYENLHFDVVPNTPKTIQQLIWY